MKLLHRILGINVPTVDEVKDNIQQNLLEQQQSNVVGYITFILTNDGTINAKTEWSEESPQTAKIYAQMLYQISCGAMEDGLMDLLLKYGDNNIKSQDFIGEVVKQFNICQQKYKNLPIIHPSQALSVAPYKDNTNGKR